MSERTYSELDVADLIARAVERQQEARRRTPEVGLTLDEVERIGRETGIDPAHLRAAAAEMDAAGRTLTRQTTTSDKHVGVERWIDAPLSPEGWEDGPSRTSRDHFGLSMASGMSSGGTVQQVGNAYEWQHTSTLGVQTTVTASPRDGRTRLRMRQLVGMASPTVEGAAYGFLPALLAGLGGGAGGRCLGRRLGRGPAERGARVRTRLGRRDRLPSPTSTADGARKSSAPSTPWRMTSATRYR